MIMSFRASAIGILVFVTGLAADADAANCPTPVARSIDGTASLQRSPPHALKPYAITQTVRHYYEAPFGLGFLEVGKLKSRHYYDWMFELDLPLWRQPDAPDWLGWLSGGRLHSTGGIDLLTGAGMVETEYEHSSFIVWETRGDWLRLKLTGDLFAWVNRCHLDKAGLVFVSWETFFRRHKNWLHFRRPVAHRLRATPDVNGPLIATIGLNHKLILHDIKGDWMKVTVEQPDYTCADPGPQKPAVQRHQGWIKWRDEKGPWIYVYTRGC